MAQKRPQTITLSEIEKAVTSAVQQVQHQKTLTGADLARAALSWVDGYATCRSPRRSRGRC